MGMGSRIQGVKTAPDPGSGSATLPKTVLLYNKKIGKKNIVLHEEIAELFRLYVARCTFSYAESRLHFCYCNLSLYCFATLRTQTKVIRTNNPIDAIINNSEFVLVNFLSWGGIHGEAHTTMNSSSEHVQYTWLELSRLLQRQDDFLLRTG